MNDTLPVEDEFYASRVNVFKQKSGSFKAIGRIVRKDTQETVGGAISFESDEERARMECLQRMGNDMSCFPRPPYEWNLVNRRNVVKAYIEFQDGLKEIAYGFESARATDTLSKEGLSERVVGLVEYVTENIASIGRSFDALPESDRKALCSSIEEFSDKEVSPLRDYEIDARFAICSLFIKK